MFWPLCMQGARTEESVEAPPHIVRGEERRCCSAKQRENFRLKTWHLINCYLIDHKRFCLTKKYSIFYEDSKRVQK
jgi:hypothetical protein